MVLTSALDFVSGLSGELLVVQAARSGVQTIAVGQAWFSKRNRREV